MKIVPKIGIYKVYKWIGWFTIAFALFLLAFRTAIIFIAPSAKQVQTWLSKALNQTVVVEQAEFSFKIFNPSIRLLNVDLKAQDGSTAVHIEEVQSVLSLFHVVLGQFKANELVIDGTKLQVNITPEYAIQILGLTSPLFDFKSVEKPQGSFFKKIIIQNCDIQLALPGQNPLLLKNIHFLMSGTHVIKLRASADIDNQEGTSLNIAADFSPLNFKGDSIYVHLTRGNIAQILTFFPNTTMNKVKGQVDLEAWVQLGAKEEIAVTSKVHFEDLEFKKSDSGFKLAQASGILVAKYSSRDWQLEGKEWRLDGQQKSHPLDFSIHAQTKVDGNIQFVAHQLPFETVYSVLRHLPFTSLIQQWPIYPVHGQLDYVHLSLNKNLSLPQIHFADVVFTDVALETDGEFPSTSSISGAFTFDGKEGKGLIQSDNTQLSIPKVLPRTLNLANLSLLFNWQMNQDELLFKLSSLQALVEETPLTAQGTFKFSTEHRLPEVDLFAQLDALTTTKALTLLPRTYMDDDLLKWLDQAIKGGSISSTALVLRGDLRDFPFDNQEGVFEVSSELEGIELDYAPSWPKLTDLKANLLFHNRSLFINGEKASMEGARIIDVDAVIIDLSAKKAELKLDAKVESRLEHGVSVIEHSQLKERLGKMLAPFNLQGDMLLSLGLDIPLAQSADPIEVRGLIELKEATVEIPAWDIAIHQLQGGVTFTEKDLKADGLKGKLFGQDTQFQFHSFEEDNESKFNIFAKGRVKLEPLQAWLKMDDSSQIAGETDYSGSITISAQDFSDASISISSSLQGVKVQAPLPLQKSAEDIRMLELKMYFDPNKSVRVSTKYGDDVNAVMSLNQQDNRWLPLGGHIHFGDTKLAKFREDHIILIDGEIEKLDFSKWKSFFAPMSTSDAMVLEPMLEIVAKNLVIYDEEFANVKIEAQRDQSSRIWNFNFDGASLKGHIAFNQNESTQDILVDLDKLILTEKVDMSSLNHLEKPKYLYPVEIKIKELNVGKKHFSNIHARLEPTESGYKFPQVNAKMNATDVSLSGTWDYFSEQKKVQAQGKITTRNVSDVLNAFGVEGSLRGAKGTIGFALEWEGSPVKVDFPTLGGHAEFNLKQGSIQGVNPGMGRVLNLLNLDNVKRRLNLDFSDVTKNGLAFDELTGKLQFGKGKISSNKVLLNGPSAKIEAFGQADIENQGLDGEMVVMPNVTGSLPVAAAIAAGNPAVGAAVWVFDKMLGNKIQEIHRYRYKVLGTWQTPQVEEVPMGIPGRG